MARKVTKKAAAKKAAPEQPSDEELNDEQPSDEERQAAKRIERDNLRVELEAQGVEQIDIDAALKAYDDGLELVLVEATCRNVHVGNGQILKTHRTKNDKGKEVDRREQKLIPANLAEILVENEQVKYVGETD